MCVYHRSYKSKDIFSVLNKHRDLIDDYFWKYYSNYTADFFSKYIEDVCDFIDLYGKVLSIGCGHGLNEMLIVDINDNVTEIIGIDVVATKIKSMNIIANLLDIQNVKGILGKGEELIFPNESFDCIIIIESLSHVSDQNKIIQESVRVLKRNGKILVMDFNNGANPRILFKCWKDIRFNLSDEHPVNPYYIRNRLVELKISDIIIKPYRFTHIFDEINNKVALNQIQMPDVTQLLLTKGFMLKGAK